ncbi:MAG: efflux RND transporter periplasmic adaptor subunit [Verrucomicrobia bacterium]|nr:efflux RND transporter periplasmic adaptor subunit [Verrucomicrobiota bacterium]
MLIPRPFSACLGLARRHPRWTLAAGALLVITWFLVRPTFRGAASAAAVYEVKRGDFLVTIVEGGSLEAVNEIVIRNEVEGAARIIYIVPEGSFVKKGELLVRLDTADATDRVNQQEIAYEKAKAAFVQAEKNLEIERSVVQSSIDAAELKVRFAELDLEKFNKGQRLQEMRNAEIEITTATGDLLLAKDTLEWSVRLFEKGFETKNAVDQGSNTVQDLTLRLEKAQTNLWMLSTFDHPKQFETYRSSLEEASNNLVRVKAQGEGRLATLGADLTTQSNSLALTYQQLQNDKEQLEKSKIYAPSDGLVVYAAMQGRFSSQSMIEEGAMVRERQELIKLPDTTQMKVSIKVHESHVNKVRAGQPAFVVLDPMPDKRFQGAVSKVAVLPDTQSMFGNPNLKVYKTEVVVTDPLPDVKPGVSARAEIVITNIPQALTVPLQAVTTRQGKTVVFVKEGGDSTPVPVEVGLFNTKFIEVVRGLKEGDLVLLAPPYDIEEKDLGGAIIAQNEPVPPSRPDLAARNHTNGLEEPAFSPQPVSPLDGASPMRGGSPDAGERKAGDPRSGGNREEIMKRFDKDGNGQLDEAERAALREVLGGGGGRSPRRRSGEASDPGGRSDGGSSAPPGGSG